MFPIQEMIPVSTLVWTSALMLATALGASDQTVAYMTFLVTNIGVLPVVNNFFTSLHHFMDDNHRHLWWTPVARVHLMDINYRVSNTASRFWYTLNCYVDFINEYIGSQSTPVLMQPCTWCGLPTGNWCDGCEELRELPARAICTECETVHLECRVCDEY